MGLFTYFHKMDPFIIHFTGSLGIRWYSMAYLMGAVIGYYMIYKWLIKTRCSPLSKNQLSDQVIWIFAGVLLGGRLGYAVFYDTELLTRFDGVFPFWEFLKIYHGGLASHGGIIGLILAVWFFAKKHKLSLHHCLDISVLGGGVGIFLGRLANFINGELYGRVITGKALWAVQFPQEMTTWVAEKKVELLNKLAPAVQKLQISADTWKEWVEQLSSGAGGGSAGRIYSAIGSLISACERGNKEIIAALKEILFYRHPSQVYQAFLEGLLPFLLAWWFWRKKARTPGLIAGIWAFSYTVMRIVGEQFRMPDAHIGFQALGLTRGQWLSLAMMLGVICYIVWVLNFQKSSEKWGGWKQME